MSASTVCAPLWDLAPIDLAELNGRAALQTRVDRKYVLGLQDVVTLLGDVSPDTRVLEIKGGRSFAYQSVYFDTPDLTTYMLAAHRRRRRFKVRTRTYLDSSLCWLEVKTRGPRRSTVKHRLPYVVDDREFLVPGRWFVNRVLAGETIKGYDLDFAPVLDTRYRRSTLLLPATESRVTIDTDLAWEDPEGRRLSLEGLAIVETKTGSVPSCVDRLLWERGYRPVRISKYATGLAALRPDLPAARWRRTLRRYFGHAAASPLASETTSWLQAS